METWCETHRAAYCDSTEQAERTLKLMAALGSDQKYLDARAAHKKAVGTARDRLELEAAERFTPVCCYLGDEKIREVFGIETQ